MAIRARIKSAWNAFGQEEVYRAPPGVGMSSTGRPPDQPRLRFSNERSIIASVYTRIGVDVASIPIRHVQLDDKGRYSKDLETELSLCLNLEANIDQAPMAFRLDLVTSLFDKGAVAIVPVDTTIDPVFGEEFDILSMRIGEITTWYPKHVRVAIYNEALGIRQEVVLPKRNVAIVYNPLFAVMNEQNSTLQRLIRKLSILDAVDEQSGSGKLDIIIQLPYVVKTPARKLQAEERRKDIEMQLKGSQYGIAYTDGTEKITQLNRPAENNLLKQVEYLTNLLYSELGITAGIMDGTADEAAMLNYYNRTVEPILMSVVEAMQRAFVGRAGVRKKKRIMYIQNPFKLVPLSQIAEISDKLTRNEIVTANEMRGFIGMTPHEDPKADKLINSNMPQPAAETGSDLTEVEGIMNETLKGVLDDVTRIVGGQGAT
ncbi:phage portal protein [uncultured Gordonia sp.]|uniref:phage portal protein n=1 Tax=uncultured Gordonia sp. TaxID=198437 RepID=UPI00260F7411|nr:phage portal protein [uncultured Gordonia sp.]